MRCWADDPKRLREDLLFPLDEWGTGVGQVIAILYAAIMQQEPCCIVIDEPNSYLHPGAAKKLIDVLKLHPQHQYIVATHSAEIIKAANPEQVVHLAPSTTGTVVSTLKLSQLDQLRSVLADIGVGLSDVFGADQVLWVEGQTEAECFPILIRDLLQKPLLGVAVRHVSSVSELVGQRAKAIERFVKLYEEVSRGCAIIPTAVAFVFDPIELSENKRGELTRIFGPGLRFLPRVNYESYLIHPSAIAVHLNASETFKAATQVLTEETVLRWLEQHGHNPKYHPHAEVLLRFGEPSWHASVDGATLLEDLFQSISDAKEQYRKIPYSAQLTRWIIQNDKPFLDELAQFLGPLLKSV